MDYKIKVEENSIALKEKIRSLEVLIPITCIADKKEYYENAGIEIRELLCLRKEYIGSIIQAISLEQITPSEAMKLLEDLVDNYSSFRVTVDKAIDDSVEKKRKDK